MCIGTAALKRMRSCLELLECEGSLARQLRFHLFHSWNLQEASHDSFVSTASTRGISRKLRTTASLSLLQLVEFEGSLARKLRFHESWMR